MRCLVTGATGFLGSHLVRELLARQHGVVVFLRPGAQANRLADCLSQANVIRGDLENRSELLRNLRDEPVDVAFHLAWSGVTAEHRNNIEQVTYNVIHSLEFWSILQQTGCKTLIGLGSQAEYGPHPEMITENTPTHPITAYGSAKLALYILLRQLCMSAGVRFIWLRLFSAYGPGDDDRHMVPCLIKALLRKERPSLTAAEQVWDYLYVTDAVAAMCTFLENDISGVYNLGSGEPCVLRDFILKVRACIDTTLPLGFGEIPYRPDQVMNLRADISKLKSATGWKPEVSLEEGILRTVDWFRNQAERQS